MTERMVGQQPSSALLRISPEAEVIRDRIVARHGGLWEHNPFAVERSAVALVAFNAVTGGKTDGIRVDRGERYREMQADGTTGFQSEDFFAVGLACEQGREAVIAWAQVLLDTLGARVVLNDAPDAPGALLTATAAVARDAGEFVAAAAEAQADGRIDAREQEDLERRARRLVQGIEVSVRVSAHQALKDGGR